MGIESKFGCEMGRGAAHARLDRDWMHLEKKREEAGEKWDQDCMYQTR